MPRPSERQALIQAILLATEEDISNYYYRQLEGEEDLLNELDNYKASSSDSSSTTSSSTTSNSTSSRSSSSSDPAPPRNNTPDLTPDDAEVFHQNISSNLDFLNNVLNSRYLHLDTDPVPKCSQLYMVLVEYRESNIRGFRRNLRVSPSTFDALVSKIEGHPIFHNRSNIKQYPVEIQLAIALFRFGHDGNAASVEGIAQWAGVSAGMVVKATRRVIIAVLALHDQAIRWASDEEKEAAKEWVELSSCPAWRDGYCMVDGTLVPLFEKPGYHGEAYFDRKSNYSLNVQLITLPNLRIIDYVVGYCGSAHDATVFRESRAYKRNRLLFKGGEWLWADSAYALDVWCVTPYKKPLSERRENKRFNYYLSKVRVKSEHAMGYIKGRFCSLRGLRQQIDDTLDHQRALAWIKACIVLHTLIFDIENGEEDPEFVRDLIDEGQEQTIGPSSGSEDDAREAQRQTRGQAFREFLKKELFKYYDF